MVSFWPWKGEDNSPASFEKALSTISAKISKTNLQLDSLRQGLRRVKALWTLYALFAYILVVIVLIFVVGHKNWYIKEYGVLILGPVLIYGVRLAIVAYYEWRIGTVSSRLRDQEKERETTVKKLKDATKYDSTLQLLEKYGAKPKPKPESSPEKANKPKPKQAGPEPVRTGFLPPPTANIPRNRGGRQSLPPNFPSGAPTEEFAPNAFTDAQGLSKQKPPTAEFAPNSFAPQWYDRILDVVLGEDETLPKNRLALLCQKCRMVNGLAPPGVRTLQQLGRWQCHNCKEWNGEEAEVEKTIEAVMDTVREEKEQEETEKTKAGTDPNEDEEPEIEEKIEQEADTEKPRKTRSKKSK